MNNLQGQIAELKVELLEVQQANRFLRKQVQKAHKESILLNNKVGFFLGGEVLTQPGDPRSSRRCPRRGPGPAGAARRSQQAARRYAAGCRTQLATIQARLWKSHRHPPGGNCCRVSRTGDPGRGVGD